MQQLSPNRICWTWTSAAAMLLLAYGSVGCAHLDESWGHHWRKHSLVSAVNEKHEGRYYHCPHCGQIIPREGFYKCPRCMSQAAFYGYEPTCWRQFPDGWGCPPEQVTNNPGFWDHGLLESDAPMPEPVAVPEGEEVEMDDSRLEEGLDFQGADPPEPNDADDVGLPTPIFDAVESKPWIDTEQPPANDQPRISGKPVPEMIIFDHNDFGKIDPPALSEDPETTAVLEPTLTDSLSDQTSVAETQLVTPDPSEPAVQPQSSQSALAGMLEQSELFATEQPSEESTTSAAEIGRHAHPLAAQQQVKQLPATVIATPLETIGPSAVAVPSQVAAEIVHPPAEVAVAELPTQPKTVEPNELAQPETSSQPTANNEVVETETELAPKPFDEIGPIPIRKVQLSLTEFAPTLKQPVKTTLLKPVAKPKAVATTRTQPTTDNTPTPVRQIVTPVAAPSSVSSKPNAKAAVKTQAPAESQPKSVVPVTNAEAFPMPVRRIPIAD